MNNINFKELDRIVLDSYKWEEMFILDGIRFDYDGKDHGKQKYRVIPDDFPEFVGINGTNTGTGSKPRLQFFDSSKTGIDYADSRTAKHRNSNGTKNRIVIDLIQAHALRNHITKGQASLDLAKIKGLPVPQDGTVNRERLLQTHFSNDIKALNKPENKDILEYLLDRGLLKKDPKTNKIINNSIGFNEYRKRISFAHKDKNGNIVYISYRILPQEVFLNKYPEFTPKDYKQQEKYGKYNHPNPEKYSNLNDKVPYNYYYSCKYSNNYEIYLTEGIPDSQTLLINGKNNICLGSANVGNDVWNDFVLPLLKETHSHDPIIFSGDNDNVGRSAVYNWIDNYMIPNNYTNFYVIIIPRNLIKSEEKKPFSEYFLSDTDVEKLYPNGSIKDINDYYIQNNYSLDGLDEYTVHGFTYLALVYKNENKQTAYHRFKNEIIRPHYCNMRKFELDLIIEELKQYKIFKEEEILQLKDYIDHAPSQNEVVNKIKEKYKLMYDPNGQIWYLFNGKVWEQIYSSNIETLIQEEYGSRFKDGAQLPKVIKLLRSDREIINNNIVFDQGEFIVFNNGTLYLEGNRQDTHFEENTFNPEDLATWISDFDYNPNAQFPKWIKFLNQAMETRDINGDVDRAETQAKINMLREFAGYTLFSDCSLEKMLITTGDGGNGKNTYFDTFKHVYDPKSYGSKSITSFGKDHSLSFLEGKRLNISSESKSGLYGAEERIKELVSGSEVTDDPKYKNDITFTNHAKLIVSGNNDFFVEDKTNGILRRLLFVDFPNIFTEDEKLYNSSNPRYKKGNPDLQKELIKEELSGIFNWMLEGYYTLKKNKKFTLSKEHKRKIEEFKLNNNPIRVFIFDDNFWTGKPNYFGDDNYQSTEELEKEFYSVGLDEIFDRYKDFCLNYQYKFTSNKRTFSILFKKQLEDLNIPFTTKRERSRIDSNKMTTRFYFQERPSNFLPYD